jgi:hypothetical protein
MGLNDFHSIIYRQPERLLGPNLTSQTQSEKGQPTVQFWLDVPTVKPDESLDALFGYWIRLIANNFIGHGRQHSQSDGAI